MKLSQTIGALAKALSQAQGEIGNAKKNAKNPHFKSTYADLAEVLDTVRPIASKYGLAISQCPAMKDGKAIVETILIHESGEYIIFDPSEAVLQKQDAQGVGSATTYLRRYSIAAVFGIAQEDDDGNTASKPVKAEVQQEAPKELTEAEKAAISVAYIKKNGSKDWLDKLEACTTDTQRINLAKELKSELKKA